MKIYKNLAAVLMVLLSMQAAIGQECEWELEENNAGERMQISTDEALGESELEPAAEEVFEIALEEGAEVGGEILAEELLAAAAAEIPVIGEIVMLGVMSYELIREMVPDYAWHDIGDYFRQNLPHPESVVDYVFYPEEYLVNLITHIGDLVEKLNQDDWQHRVENNSAEGLDDVVIKTWDIIRRPFTYQKQLEIDDLNPNPNMLSTIFSIPKNFNEEDLRNFLVGMNSDQNFGTSTTDVNNFNTLPFIFSSLIEHHDSGPKIMIETKVIEREVCHGDLSQNDCNIVHFTEEYDYVLTKHYTSYLYNNVSEITLRKQDGPLVTSHLIAEITQDWYRYASHTIETTRDGNTSLEVDNEEFDLQHTRTSKLRAYAFTGTVINGALDYDMDNRIEVTYRYIAPDIGEANSSYVVTIEDADLSPFAGQTVYIGFFASQSISNDYPESTSDLQGDEVMLYHGQFRDYVAIDDVSRGDAPASDMHAFPVISTYTQFDENQQMKTNISGMSIEVPTGYKEISSIRIEKMGSTDGIVIHLDEYYNNQGTVNAMSYGSFVDADGHLDFKSQDHSVLIDANAKTDTLILDISSVPFGVMDMVHVKVGYLDKKETKSTLVLVGGGTFNPSSAYILTVGIDVLIANDASGNLVNHSINQVNDPEKANWLVERFLPDYPVFALMNESSGKVIGVDTITLEVGMSDYDIENLGIFWETVNHDDGTLLRNVSTGYYLNYYTDGDIFGIGPGASPITLSKGSDFAPIIENATYFIQPEDALGEALGYQASGSPDLTFEPPSESNPVVSQWEFEYTGFNRYAIKNVANGNYLANIDGNVRLSESLYLWEIGASITPNRGEFFRIKDGSSELMLSLSYNDAQNKVISLLKTADPDFNGDFVLTSDTDMFIDTELLAHYHFNEDVRDYSGHAHHGVLKNGTSLSYDSDRGHAAYFSGDNQYISVEIDVPETEYAVSFWFKTRDPNAGIYSVVEEGLTNVRDRTIYLKNGNLRARTHRYPNPKVIESSGVDYADNKWHHVVHTVGESIGGQKLYVDGQLVASDPQGFSDFDWQEFIHIGRAVDAGSDFLDGYIDEFKVWNKALTKSDVLSEYDGSLFAYYPLNYNAKDYSGNGLDGTNHGADWTNGFVDGAAEFADDNDKIMLRVPDLTGESGSVSLFYRTDELQQAFIFFASSGGGDGVLGTNSIRLEMGLEGLEFWFDNHYDKLETNQASDFDGSWHHVIATWDRTAGETKLYVDGKLADSHSGLEWNNFDLKHIYLGNSRVVSYLDFSGQIDEVKIFPHALSDDEIQDLFKPYHLERSIDHPIAYYPLDNDYNDHSGNEHHGTNNSATLTPNGQLNGGASFDGYAYIDLPSGILNSRQGSVSMIVKAAEFGGVLIDGHNRWFDGSRSRNDIFTISLEPSQVFSYLGGDNPTIQNAYIDADWHHLVYTWDHTQNEVRLFVDGAEQVSSTHGGDLFDFTTFRLGIKNDGSFPFSGTMDEVRLYDYALSAQDVTDLNEWYPQNHDSNLIAYYPFNEDPYDHSLNDHHGTFGGDAGIIIDSERGPVASFDNYDYVEISDDSDFAVTKELTMSTWFKTDHAGSTNMAMIRWRLYGYGLFMNYGQEGKLFAFVDGQGLGHKKNSVEIAAGLNDDQWHHTAVTFDGQLLRMYLDGNLVDENVLSTAVSIRCESGGFGLGRDGTNNAQFYVGLLDDTKIWDRALSLQEILDEYEEGNASISPIAYYPLDDDFDDHSGNGHHGINQGVTLTAPFGENYQGPPAVSEGWAEFDGSDYIDLPGGILNSEKGSVSLLTKFNASTSGHLFYASDNSDGTGFGSHDFHLTNFGELYVLYGAGMYAYFPNDSDIWHHFTITWDSQQVLMYFDGLEVIRIDHDLFGSPVDFTTLKLGKGGSNELYAFPYTGELDEVRLYDIALTADEVQALTDSYGLAAALNSRIQVEEHKEALDVLTAESLSIYLNPPDVLTAESLSIYPNPTDEAFTIVVPDYFGESVNITLRDFIGKVVKSIDVRVSDTREVIFEVRTVQAGIYILNVQGETNRVISTRVIIK